MSNARQKIDTDIKEDVKQFIVNNFLFGVQEDTLKDSASFLENGILDSTGILELIQYIEENYKINVEDNELVPENLDSLNNVTEFINKKLADRE